MKYKINILILLFMICSCDNHDFELRYKEQALYIHNMLHISIEPLNNLDKAYSYLVFLRQYKPYDTIDTIHLEKRLSNSFRVVETSSDDCTSVYRSNVHYIRVYPNTKYKIEHLGMGARVRIINYFQSDSSGKLHSVE